MFWKKKKERRVYVHPQFGEMKYGFGWAPPFMLKLSIWDKTYDLPLSFLAENEDEDITPEQEEAFEKVKQIIVEHRDEIEKMAYPEFGSEEAVSDRIIPHEIWISRKGESAVFFRDVEEEKEFFGPDYDFEKEGYDDHDPGFAIVMLPMPAVIDADLGFSWLCGFDSIDSVKRFGYSIKQDW